MSAKQKLLARARLVSSRMTAADKIWHQHQVRETASQLPALTPAIEEALGQWTQITDGVSWLTIKVAVAEQALRLLRGKLHGELARYALAENLFRGAIEHQSQSDPVSIRSFGYEAQVGRSAPPARLEPPASLLARHGNKPGTVELVWKKAAGPSSYAAQMSPEPATDASWTGLTPGTRSRSTVSGLGPGARSWFRVATVGASGQSGHGEPVAATAS